ncbi:FxSxx-COOH system tetratricopeptide repeat protein [Streptomyces sp. NPDC014006]|uniref:FxSxx-COOH system tetratricopeptide repeat protein n=1 Tax=Streptomyces sp. NPDC014006 TaxID=3364870 RepID=UPI0036F76420
MTVPGIYAGQPSRGPRPVLIRSGRGIRRMEGARGMPEHHRDPIKDPVEMLGRELAALYKAAKKPSYEELAEATGTPKSTLHEWVAGTSVPASKNQFATLIAVLRNVVAHRESVPYEGHSDTWWEELRRRAWRHKQTVAKQGHRLKPRRAVGHVPVTVDCYEDRAGLRGLLETAAPGGTTVLGQVITGMGGVGKTQLAAAYARTAYDEGAVDVLVWVTASSRAAVTDGFTDAAARLLDVQHDDPGAAAAFLNWLALAPGTKDSSQVPGARWLIVLDDVPQPEALRGLWPPDVPHGQTLITTRNRDAALMDSHRRRIDVGCFSPEEARSYLDAKLATHGRQEAPDQVAGLAEDLGRLPLALSQAIPYMANRRLDCAAYRARLADRAKTLTDVLPAAGGLPDQQSRTVAAAWDLSIELADQQPPVGLARPVLHLASLLDPNGIPGTVLTAEPVLAALQVHTPRSASGIPSPDGIQEALWNLHQFSLIEHSPEHACQTVRVHQLLQRAVHERLPDAVRRAWIATAADALRIAWPDVERDVELAAALRANTDTLYQRYPETLRLPVTHDLLYRWGQSLGEAGRADAARDHFQRLIDALEPELGPDHLDTLSVRNHHARWQGEAGDAAGARDAFEALVPRMNAALGDDHAQTLIARNNAAYWRGRAGDAAGATEGLAELLPDMVRKRGPFHRQVLAVRGNLARWRGEAGDTAGAIAAMSELLEDRRRVLGSEDPDTLATLHDLAAMRGEAGDAAGAVEAYRDLLDIRGRVLGDHDPNTLQTRSNLAYWLGQAGDPAAAVVAYTEQLEYQSALLGVEHPDTLAVLNNLAGMRGECGDVTGAARAFAEVVTLMERVYGDCAPATLTARNNLAHYMGESGDSAGALDAFTKLLTIQVEALGNTHPSTLTTRINQATWLARTGDTAAAAKAFGALIGDTAQVHGKTHRMTLAVLASFAGCLREVRSAEATVRALTTALSSVERFWGTHHSLTRLLRDELVRLRSKGKGGHGTSKKR